MARRLGAAMLGGAILWAVAREAGPRDCRAIIHVAGDGLAVVVDGRAQPCEGDWYSPMVCDLGPGHLTMTAHRGGRRVPHEVFELGPGEQVVLTAMADASYEVGPTAATRAAMPGPAAPGSRRGRPSEH